MPASFLFYDLETFGSDPRRSRIAQFAAIRTDADLNVVDEPISLFVKPANDLLPSPVATLITGITPQRALREGVNEADIFARMSEAMSQGRTLSESYFVALKTTGIAIFYTALTLAVGVAMWIFSDLKFQADMGVMLTFMFLVNMIAAIVFLPALCRWLLRPFEKR